MNEFYNNANNINAQNEEAEEPVYDEAYSDTASDEQGNNAPLLGLDGQPAFTDEQRKQMMAYYYPNLLANGEKKEARSRGFLPALGRATTSGIAGGAGNQARTAAEVANAYGHDTAGGLLGGFADYMNDVVKENAPDEDMTTAEYIATAIGNAFGTSLVAIGESALLLALASAGLGALGVGGTAAAATGAIAANAPKAARLANAIKTLWRSSAYGKLLIARVPAAAGEGMMEAGNLITDMREKGFTDEEIYKAAKISGGVNTLFLMLSSMVGSGLEAKILGLGTKNSIKNVAKMGIGEFAGKASKRALLGATQQGGEEIVQSGIGTLAQGGKMDWRQAIEEGKMGAIGGIALEGIPGAISDVVSRGTANATERGRDYFTAVDNEGNRHYYVDGNEVTEEQYDLHQASAEGIESKALRKVNGGLMLRADALNDLAHNTFGKDLSIIGTSENAIDLDASNLTAEERGDLKEAANELGFDKIEFGEDGKVHAEFSHIAEEEEEEEAEGQEGGEKNQNPNTPQPKTPSTNGEIADVDEALDILEDEYEETQSAELKYLLENGTDEQILAAANNILQQRNAARSDETGNETNENDEADMDEDEDDEDEDDEFADLSDEELPKEIEKAENRVAAIKSGDVVANVMEEAAAEGRLERLQREYKRRGLSGDTDDGYDFSGWSDKRLTKELGKAESKLAELEETAKNGKAGVGVRSKAEKAAAAVTKRVNALRKEHNRRGLANNANNAGEAKNEFAKLSDEKLAKELEKAKSVFDELKNNGGSADDLHRVSARIDALQKEYDLRGLSYDSSDFEGSSDEQLTKKLVRAERRVAKLEEELKSANISERDKINNALAPARSKANALRREYNRRGLGDAAKYEKAYDDYLANPKVDKKAKAELSKPATRKKVLTAARKGGLVLYKGRGVGYQGQGYNVYGYLSDADATLQPLTRHEALALSSLTGKQLKTFKGETPTSKGAKPKKAASNKGAKPKKVNAPSQPAKSASELEEKLDEYIADENRSQSDRESASKGRDDILRIAQKKGLRLFKYKTTGKNGNVRNGYAYTSEEDATIQTPRRQKIVAIAYITGVKIETVPTLADVPVPTAKTTKANSGGKTRTSSKTSAPTPTATAKRTKTSAPSQPSAPATPAKSADELEARLDEFIADPKRDSTTKKRAENNRENILRIAQKDGLRLFKYKGTSQNGKAITKHAYTSAEDGEVHKIREAIAAPIAYISGVKIEEAASFDAIPTPTVAATQKNKTSAPTKNENSGNGEGSSTTTTTDIFAPITDGLGIANESFRLELDRLAIVRIKRVKDGKMTAEEAIEEYTMGLEWRQQEEEGTAGYISAEQADALLTRFIERIKAAEETAAPSTPATSAKSIAELEKKLDEYIADEDVTLKSRESAKKNRDKILEIAQKKGLKLYSYSRADEGYNYNGYAYTSEEDDGVQVATGRALRAVEYITGVKMETVPFKKDVPAPTKTTTNENKSNTSTKSSASKSNTVRGHSEATIDVGVSFAKNVGNISTANKMDSSVNELLGAIADGKTTAEEAKQSFKNVLDELWEDELINEYMVEIYSKKFDEMADILAERREKLWRTVDAVEDTKTQAALKKEGSNVLRLVAGKDAVDIIETKSQDGSEFALAAGDRDGYFRRITLSEAMAQSASSAWGQKIISVNLQEYTGTETETIDITGGLGLAKGNQSELREEAGKLLKLVKSRALDVAEAVDNFNALLKRQQLSGTRKEGGKRIEQWQAAVLLKRFENTLAPTIPKRKTARKTATVDVVPEEEKALTVEERAEVQKIRSLLNELNAVDAALEKQDNKELRKRKVAIEEELSERTSKASAGVIAALEQREENSSNLTADGAGTDGERSSVSAENENAGNNKDLEKAYDDYIAHSRIRKEAKAELSKPETREKVLSIAKEKGLRLIKIKHLDVDNYSCESNETKTPQELTRAEAMALSKITGKKIKPTFALSNLVGDNAEDSSTTTFDAMSSPSLDTGKPRSANEFLQELLKKRKEQLAREKASDSTGNASSDLNEEKARKLRKKVFGFLEHSFKRLGIKLYTSKEDMIEYLEKSGYVARKSIDETLGVEVVEYFAAGQWRRLYGFTPEGVGKVVYVDREVALSSNYLLSTPVHEYGHLWVKMIKRAAPNLWSELRIQLQEMPEWDVVEKDQWYAQRGNDAIAEEVLVRILGTRGAKRLLQKAEQAEQAGRKIGGLARLLHSFMEYVRKLLSKLSGVDYSTLSLDRVIDLAMEDVFSGKTLEELEEKYAKSRGSNRQTTLTRRRYREKILRIAKTSSRPLHERVHIYIYGDGSPEAERWGGAVNGTAQNSLLRRDAEKRIVRAVNNSPELFIDESRRDSIYAVSYNGSGGVIEISGSEFDAIKFFANIPERDVHKNLRKSILTIPAESIEAIITKDNDLAAFKRKAISEYNEEVEELEVRKTNANGEGLNAVTEALSNAPVDEDVIDDALSFMDDNDETVQEKVKKAVIKNLRSFATTGILGSSSPDLSFFADSEWDADRGNIEYVAYKYYKYLINKYYKTPPQKNVARAKKDLSPEEVAILEALKDANSYAAGVENVALTTAQNNVIEAQKRISAKEERKKALVNRLAKTAPRYKRDRERLEEQIARLDLENKLEKRAASENARKAKALTKKGIAPVAKVEISEVEEAYSFLDELGVISKMRGGERAKPGEVKEKRDELAKAGVGLFRALKPILPDLGETATVRDLARFYLFLMDKRDTLDMEIADTKRAEYGKLAIEEWEALRDAFEVVRMTTERQGARMAEIADAYDNLEVAKKRWREAARGTDVEDLDAKDAVKKYEEVRKEKRYQDALKKVEELKRRKSRYNDGVVLHNPAIREDVIREFRGSSKPLRKFDTFTLPLDVAKNFHKFFDIQNPRGRLRTDLLSDSERQSLDDALAQAEKLESDGATTIQIFAQTGLYRGPFGDWMLHIDNFGRDANGKRLKASDVFNLDAARDPSNPKKFKKCVYLSEIYQPETILFYAVPELSHVKVLFEKAPTPDHIGETRSLPEPWLVLYWTKDRFGVQQLAEGANRRGMVSFHEGTHTIQAIFDAVNGANTSKDRGYAAYNEALNYIQKGLLNACHAGAVNVLQQNPSLHTALMQDMHDLKAEIYNARSEVVAAKQSDDVVDPVPFVSLNDAIVKFDKKWGSFVPTDFIAYKNFAVSQSYALRRITENADSFAGSYVTQNFARYWNTYGEHEARVSASEAVQLSQAEEALREKVVKKLESFSEEDAKSFCEYLGYVTRCEASTSDADDSEKISALTEMVDAATSNSVKPNVLSLLKELAYSKAGADGYNVALTLDIYALVTQAALHTDLVIRRPNQYGGWLPSTLNPVLPAKTSASTPAATTSTGSFNAFSEAVAPRTVNERILAATTTRSPLTLKGKLKQLTAKEFWQKQSDDTMQKWVDSDVKAHSLDEAFEKKTGKKLSREKSMYESIRYAARQSAAIVNALMGRDKSGRVDYSLVFDAINDTHFGNKKLKHKATLQNIVDKIDEAGKKPGHNDFLSRHGYENGVKAFGSYVTLHELLERSKIHYDLFKEEEADWLRRNAEREAWIANGRKGKAPQTKEWEEYDAFRRAYRNAGDKYRNECNDAYDEWAQNGFKGEDPRDSIVDPREEMKERWIKEHGSMEEPPKRFDPRINKRPEFVPYNMPENLTEREIRNELKDFPPEYEEAAQMFYKYNDNLLTILEDSGIISEELHNVLSNKYKRYCSLLRDFSDTASDSFPENAYTSGGVGFGNVSNPLRRASEEGSSRRVINPLETVQSMTESVVTRAVRNKVARYVSEVATKAGLDGIERLPERVWRGKLVEGRADEKNCIFTVMENGHKVAYRCAPELYDVITGYDFPTAKGLFGVAKYIASCLRTGATINPSFIIRNFFRDTVFAGISSRNGFVPIYDSIRGGWAYLHDKHFRAEYEAGGASAYRRYGDPEKAYDHLLEMSGGKNIEDYTISDIVDAFGEYRFSDATWRMALAKLRKYSEVVEASTRAGEFLRARENKKSIRGSAMDASDVTLDFSRMGSEARIWNQYIPFFNATIQGADKMRRLLRDKDTRYTAAMGLTKYIILPSLLLWLMNKDEDWYKELSPQVKYQNWCLPGGIRIPKPQEAGVAFGGALEAILDTAVAEDPVAWKNWAKSTKDIVTPNMLPQVLLPLVEWMTNYSFFKEGTLVPRRLADLPSELQYAGGTTELSKALGTLPPMKMIGMSPIAIDNFVRQYSGTLGSFVWQAPDVLLADLSNHPDKKFSELAVARDFTINDNNRTRYLNDFYEARDEIIKRHKGYGEANKEYKLIGKANSEISKISKQIRDIEASDRLDGAEKRRRIDILSDKRKQIAKRHLDAYGKNFL